MKPTRKRGKTVSKRGIKPLHIFFLILGTCGLILFAEMSKTVYPSPPVSGAGLTPVSLGNAGPDPITVLITSEVGTVYQVNITRCPTCKMLGLLAPNPMDCPAGTVYKAFALNPGSYRLEVSSSNVFNKAKVHHSRLEVPREASRSSCFFKTVTDNSNPY